jgi:glycerol kinase
MNQYVVAIDQGTTSTRAIVFDHSGSIVSSGQMEHEQIFPQAGWVEHNPAEIWNNTREVIGSALSKANLTRHDIAAVGITNQRETAVVWDKTTGEPIYNAIVWQDTRTQPIVDELAKEGGAERRGRPGQGGGRRPRLRQHRLLGALEPDRRDRRRSARHRRNQRLADHVHGP